MSKSFTTRNTGRVEIRLLSKTNGTLASSLLVVIKGGSMVYTAVIPDS
jgi:hypothetical protein